jgi:hypothetical protein
MPNDGNLFLAFRDVTTGMEHLERSSKLVSNGFSVELHAYQCHVFLEWRELRPDENHRWDLLCDFLNGRGVPNLNEALLALELNPLHDALLALLQPALVAQLAAVKEPLPNCGKEAKASTPAAKLMQQVESLASRFARDSMAIYARKVGTPVTGKDAWLAICSNIHAAVAIPLAEEEFSEPWSREARLVLPSIKLPLHPNEIWGPVLAACVLQGVAETISPKEVGATALALFERLRLREPLARAFSLGGEISEDGWRAAARVRLIFLVQSLTAAKPAKAPAEEVFAGFPRSFWYDGDARWLMRVHDAGGKEYFNKELHQQILWWTYLPLLLQPDSPKAAIERQVQEAGEQAEEAGYRLAKPEETPVKPGKQKKKALTT